MVLSRCILGKFLGVVCHCFPPPLDVPTFATRCLYVRNDAREPSSERWNCGRESPVILPKFRLPRKFRDLLHAANLRHGTDSFTSPPKEGMVRIFRPKIRRLRPGLNPRTWVLKASTLHLDHRSRYIHIMTHKSITYIRSLFYICCYIFRSYILTVIRYRIHRLVSFLPDDLYFSSLIMFSMYDWNMK